MSKLVNGDGPLPCNIAFVGESPGLTEIKTGIPFSGKSGKEFNERYLPVAGLKRKNVYVTNLSKRHIPKPTPALMEDWNLNLMWELRSVGANIVVTLGRFAAWAFIDGQPNMDEIHGIPFKAVTHYDHEITLIPCYHPAAGLHNAEMQEYIHHDFEVIREVLKLGVIPGAAIPIRDYIAPKPRGKYMLVDSTSNVYGIKTSKIIALDTENYPDGSPWGWSYSWDSPSAKWDAWVMKSRGCEISNVPLVVLHSALHDLGVLDQLDIKFNAPIADTMIMAHLLGTEPLGLKALARRHLGLEMQSYRELLAPVSQKLIRAYMSEYLGDMSKRPMPVPEYTRLFSLIKRANNDFDKGKPVDFRKRWNGWDKALTQYGKLPEASLDDIPVNESTDYAGKDAYATRLIHPILGEMIKAKGLEKVLEQDIAILPMLAEMQKTGLHVDREELKLLNDTLRIKLSVIEWDVTNIAAEAAMAPFNIASYDNISDLLFKYLKLTPIRKTKKGKRPSVAKGVLEAIKNQHEVVPLLLERSELEKLRNTYATKLPGFIKKDGKIYPNISLIRTPTGRIAMKSPNLMAQPARTELGRKIRGCFYAPEGWELASWDLDQIELRVLAHESQDHELIRVLSDPTRHIHKETCAKIYGIKLEDVDKASTEYMMTKNITFGIIYLISPQGLHSQLIERGLTITLSECQNWIKEWYRIYGGVYDWQENIKSVARMHGFVTSMLGRRRYTGGSRSPNRATANEALRQAVNHPIQAGAQEVIKAGMANMWPWMKAHLSFIKPLLQIHDELMVQVSPDCLQLCDLNVSYYMENAVKLRVPVRVSMAHGRTWKDLK